MKYLDLPDYQTPTIDDLDFRFIVNGAVLRHEAPWVQIEHWHQLVPVEIKFEGYFDVESILRETSLSSDSEIACGLSVTSTRTKLKQVSPLVSISQGKTEVIFAIDGQSVGGDLRIEAFVTVSKSLPQQLESDLAPRDWALLWSKQVHCHLEGNQARAEIHPADFSKSIYRNAQWRIHENFPDVSAEWITCELNNAIHVEYNEAHSQFIASPIGIQLLSSAYTQTIIESAISTEGVLEIMFNENIPHDTRGSLILSAQSLILAIFNSREPSQIRSQWNRNKAHFQSMLQNMTGGRA